MSILIDKDKKTMTLHTANTTYQIAVGVYGHLLHLYYGKRCDADMRYLLTYYDRGFSGNPYDAGKDRTYSCDVLPQEYPCFGNGDFRSPALDVEREDGSCGIDLRYVSAEVIGGKYELPGLPTAYDGMEEGVQTLVIHLEDALAGVHVELYYGVFPEQDMITRAACIKNIGGGTLTIRKAASASLDFLTGEYEVMHFCGRYGTERLAERKALVQGEISFGSRRGISSHQENPFFMLLQPETTEQNGECYAFSLLYSGNFRNEMEKDQFGQLRILSGISPEQFGMELPAGEFFHTPEVVMTYAEQGMEQLSMRFHRFVRTSICRSAYQEKRRPVLINNWEATYFDFTGEKLCEIAKQASELGIELFVLDDGWFGKRDNDESGLGDWTVNETKLGRSLGAISDQIHAYGMKFGLWIEPEMISEDSELYRRHPDYAFALPGRKPIRSRYQLVLDFTREEVVDAVFSQIRKLIDTVKIDYFKIDMNRAIHEVYSAAGGMQNRGALIHRYVLGMYSFLERLRAYVPDILLEGCCGGGGRFDMGMLSYVPQIWCSDNTDAVERTKIQYGTSFGYPMSCIGAHVSVVPNHQTGRITPLRTRGAVAMTGAFGYELDVCRLTEAEKETVKEQIKLYKRDWELIQKGNYYRLTNAVTNRSYAAWEYASGDGEQAILCVTMLASECNPTVPYIRLRGLSDERLYRLEETGETYTGAALMYAGIPVPRFMEAEYDTWQVHLKCLEI